MATLAENPKKGRKLPSRWHTMETLMARVQVDPDSGCWLWQGSLDANGYAVISWRGRLQRVHRMLYAQHRGPIQTETLDHICRTRRCVNYDHLRELSNVENILIGEGPPARNARKTHCLRGHNNWVHRSRPNGKTSRACLTCRVERTRPPASAPEGEK